MKRPIIVGVCASVLLLLVYLGIITLVQGMEHALEQMARLWYWIITLVVGFGVQAGLFTIIRRGLRERRASATASIATSGGLSTGSMVACCAHHLSDVLPIIGLSGLATFLVNYQLLFIIIGVLSNVVGITIMLRVIRRYGLAPKVKPIPLIISHSPAGK